MRRILGRLLALALCLMTGSMQRTVLAQGIDGPQTVYESEEFGYLFWWNAEQWVVEEQSANPGEDWVSITNGDTNFSVYGFIAPGMTPEACVRNGLSEMANTLGVTRVESLLDLGTAPIVDAWTSTSGAAGARSDYFVAYTADTGNTAFVYESACYQMGDSDALVWTSVRQSAAGFNAGSDLQPPPSRALVMPAWTWTAAADAYFGLDTQGLADSAIIPFTDGSAKGVLTIVPFGSCAGPTTIVVVGEGLGASNFILSPDALALTDGTRPTGFTWLSPPMPPDASAALASGDKAVLRLALPVSGTLWFTDQDGVSYQVGSTGGCGGGSALPIRVPLE